MNISIALLIILILVVGFVVLQVFLSRKENKWLGWILPALSFLNSIVIGLGNMLFSFGSSQVIEGVEIDGQIVEQTTEQVRVIMGNPSSMLVQTIYVFVMFNISTIILVAIYFACRQSRKRRSEVERMSIQDLE